MLAPFSMILRAFMEVSGLGMWLWKLRMVLRETNVVFLKTELGGFASSSGGMALMLRLVSCFRISVKTPSSPIK